jgi:hypothetical protein
MKYLAIISLLFFAACDAAPVYTTPMDDQIRQQADERVKKVIEQLRAECDSNLQRETYKRVQWLLQLKQQKHTRPKAAGA